MAVNSIGQNNPYAALYAQQYGGGFNEDFMSQAYGISPKNTQDTAKSQTFTGNNLSGQPATDVYQGSSATSTALKFGALAGAGTTAGLYFFGGDRVSPFADGKFDDKFLRVFEDEKLVENEVAKRYSEKLKEIYTKKGISDGYQYEALKEYAETGKKPNSVTLPKNITQAEAKAKVKEIEKLIKKIKIDKIKDEVIRTKTLEGAANHLNSLKSKKAKNAQTKIVEDLRAKLTKKVSKHWDTSKNALKETGVPEEVTKAVRNYKFSKAGKFGLIAAGVGAVLGFIFGK